MAHGRYLDISATLYETASEAVAVSLIMDMMSFFQASCELQKSSFSFLHVIPIPKSQIVPEGMECNWLVLRKVFSQRYSSRDEMVG